VKECQAEWRADKAGSQAKGITEKAYVEDCRTGKTGAKPDTPPTGTPPTQPAAKSDTPPASTPPAQPAAKPAAAPAPEKPAAPAAAATAAGQFTAEAQAKASCPSDVVVWVNLKSKIYHYSGTKNYGSTKEGAYMCQKTAIAQGMRASKTEKRPSA
jgi:hypothetical protein